MLSILQPWNRWAGARLFSGVPRLIIQEVEPWISLKHVLAFIGVRRSGKSTLLYQMMDKLESLGVPQEAMMHMNFEEPALPRKKDAAMLDALYRAYREHCYPKGRAYLFFDEIQAVEGWERWVRARNESEDIKIFVTGSSAQMMSREFGTLLTGRYISFRVRPFSFLEFLLFKKIEIPKNILKVDAPHEVEHALNEYLTWGGFPEIILNDNNAIKRKLLLQYFEDILFKDVALRHDIRDLHLLRELAIHLMAQTSTLLSLSKLSKVFEVSIEKLASYVSYLEESCLLDVLPFFSLKASERKRQPRKLHIVDPGLRTVMGIHGSSDSGRLIETLVYHVLKERWAGATLFYWKGRQEIDFLVREGGKTQCLLQVAEDVRERETLMRECAALQEGQQQFPEALLKLVVRRLPQSPEPFVEPLWHFLLEKRS